MRPAVRDDACRHVYATLAEHERGQRDNVAFLKLAEGTAKSTKGKPASAKTPAVPSKVRASCTSSGPATSKSSSASSRAPVFA